jgi:hypothetical protein
MKPEVSLVIATDLLITYPMKIKHVEGPATTVLPLLPTCEGSLAGTLSALFSC